MTIANHSPFETSQAIQTRTVLHVGCGAPDPAKLPDAFFPPGAWSEMRLDIDPGVLPDIVASITEMPMVVPGGFVLVTMPDLQQVAELVAAGKLEDAAYISAMGPIARLDMLYGYRPALAAGNAFMGHRTGFTAGTLAVHLQNAGFQNVRVQRDGHLSGARKKAL